MADMVLGSYGNASIDRWDDAFIAASNALRTKRRVWVHPHFLKGMMEIESGGNGAYPPSRCRPCDGEDCVPACGPMQIKQRFHQHRCPECDFRTVPGQIELAAHIIGMTMVEQGLDAYGALLKAYFNADDVNGTTQAAYVKRLKALVAKMDFDAGETTDPDDELTRDEVVMLITGGVPVLSDTFHFNKPNFNADGSPANLYRYGVGHGTRAANMHTGNDFFLPLGTRLHTPLAGVVRCVGARGQGDWGQSCGSFPDTITRGVGNVTILTDAGLKLTFGHVNIALVNVGDRVSAGQVVCTSGGMYSPHLHFDVSTRSPELVDRRIALNGGDYFLWDPIPKLIAVLSGQPIPEPEPVYAERLPIPQPGEFENWWQVETIEDGVPVLQSTAPGAPAVRHPLVKRELFDAVYITIGQDNRPYWVSRPGGDIAFGSRIPLAGTRLVGPAIFGPVAGADSAKVLDALYALKPALEATMRVVDETVAELEGVV